MIGVRKVVLNVYDPIPNTREDPQEYNVDGYIYIEKEGKLVNKIPFRTEENGGRSSEDEPPILRWDNPDEPLDDICLSPPFTVVGEKCIVKNGEVVEEKKHT